MENSLERFTTLDVSAVVSLPDRLRVQNVFTGQHVVDSVEHVVALRHSKLVRRQHETPAILFRTHQYHD